MGWGGGDESKRKERKRKPPVRKHQASDEADPERAYLDRGLATECPEAGAANPSHLAHGHFQNVNIGGTEHGQRKQTVQNHSRQKHILWAQPSGECFQILTVLAYRPSSTPLGIYPV